MPKMGNFLYENPQGSLTLTLMNVFHLLTRRGWEALQSLLKLLQSLQMIEI